VWESVLAWVLGQEWGMGQGEDLVWELVLAWVLGRVLAALEVLGGLALEAESEVGSSTLSKASDSPRFQVRLLGPIPARQRNHHNKESLQW